MRVRAIVEFNSSGLRSAQDILNNAGLDVIEGLDEIEEEEEDLEDEDEEDEDPLEEDAEELPTEEEPTE